MDKGKLRDYRNDYRRGELDPASMLKDPVAQFGHWMDDAIGAGIDEPTAMTLATADVSGRPSARMVLLKGYDQNGFVFFTNYSSRKGEQLSANPHAALVFFWKEFERQVRIEGRVVKTSPQESDEYFASRPVESRAGAIVSPQSRVIRDRKVLEDEMMKLLSLDERDLVRPAHWGGYRLVPEMIEFWQGRPGRLHDRIRYTRISSGWKTDRLAP